MYNPVHSTSQKTSSPCKLFRLLFGFCLNVTWMSTATFLVFFLFDHLFDRWVPHLQDLNSFSGTPSFSCDGRGWGRHCR